MWPFIKRIFTDETRWVGLCRASLGSLGFAIDSGVIPMPAGDTWVGKAFIVLGLLIRSSSSRFVPTLSADTPPSVDVKP